MAGFDEGNIFYAESIGGQGSEIDSISHSVANKTKFSQFIRTFKYRGCELHYRDILLQNYHNQNYFLNILLDDLKEYDDVFSNELIERPDNLLLLMEDVLNEIVDEITRPRIDTDKLPNFQILLKWNAISRSLRDVKADEVSKLVKISGLVVSASDINFKASKLTLACRSCRQFLPNVRVKPGFHSYMLPRKCNSATNARFGAGTKVTACPVDPYFIVPDLSQNVDYQTVKLQEAHEHVPQSEMPRHVQLFCERNLVDKAVPGNRITVIGIYSIIHNELAKPSGNNEKGVSSTYIRVLGIEAESTGKTFNFQISDDEKNEFIEFSKNPDVYDIIARSIAPNIFGFNDIKKAIACLLIGGSRKKMPDGLTRRGDINVLLLGDPGTAKSQLLKFVSECAPIAVYTSGKGSSAAGLTASVIRDPKSRKFVMEGGAMVLADGGVVCIDEFDKMREDDRVAIHEAMEQQTISIAKAGITSMLNSRTSVLAAANSVYGRWEEGKGSENIDLMPTILSRFDMIFIVRDIHDEAKDLRIASHTISMQRHMGEIKENLTTTAVTDEDVNLVKLTGTNGIIPKMKLKKYISFCRSRCGPRLTSEAAKKLVSEYVLMRHGSDSYEKDTGRKITIPITIRQAEAVIRMAESLAKMRLASFANEADVAEAIRLFQVSTLDAAISGNLEGIDEFSSKENHDVMNKLEKSLKKRMPIGSQVSEQIIVQDLLNQGYPEKATKRVLAVMIRRGELQPKMQKRIFLRVK